MKYLIITLLILTSCSPDWHIRKAQFKQPKILNKFNDTIQLTDVRLDTIYYNDTFQVVQTVTKRDTVIETRYLNPETRWETRWKYKTIRDTVRIKERAVKTQIRQDSRSERTESRQNWWVFIIIGASIGLIGGAWIGIKLF